MRFKTFYLNEASQEYNIVKVLADKIIKRLKDISYSAERYPERHKSTKTNKWIGTHKISMKEFLKDINYPKGGVFESLKDGHVYLDYGYIEKGDRTPWLTVYSNGKQKKAGGYFSPKDEFGIHLPFINFKTDLPFDGYMENFHSLIVHELTHFVQEYKNKTTKGTADLSTSEWFNNEKEQEAYLHELYRNLQNYVLEIIKDIKHYRSSEFKSPDYKKYVITSNKLKKLFETLETFKKSIRLDVAEIFLDNIKNRNNFMHLSTELRDVYNKFLEDSYLELKKEFKNVIPTKELKYDKE